MTTSVRIAYRGTTTVGLEPVQIPVKIQNLANLVSIVNSSDIPKLQEGNTFGLGFVCISRPDQKQEKGGAPG